MEERLVLAKKWMLVMLSIVAIFMILAVIRRENSTLVSEIGARSGMKMKAIRPAVETRDV